MLKNTAIYITSAFVFLFANTSFAQEHNVNRGYLSKIGDQVDNLQFSMLDGTSISLKDLYGKVVVLQFTASWCVVCREEMPHLESEVWLPNKENDFILIGIDIDEDIEKVEPFIDKMGITYPIAYDPDKTHFYQFAVKGAGVTRNVVIDKQGKIAFQTRLFDKEEFKEMKEVISSLLK